MPQTTPEQLVEVVPLGGVPGRYTYAVPPDLAQGAVPGRRVVVPFGKRPRVGIVVGPATELASGPVREVRTLLDDGPLITEELLALCRWASEYYLAPLSHALRVALPPGVLGHETLEVSLTEAGRAALGGGASAELRKALRAVELGETQVLRPATRQRLVREGLIQARHDVRAGASEPRVTVVAFQGPAENPVPSRHRVQHEAYALLAARGTLPVEELQRLVPGARDALRRFVERGWATVSEIPRARTATTDLDGEAPPPLSEAQREALDELGGALDGGTHQTFLLEGVTGSGKTEVYLRLIQRAREAHGTALVVVPEIALTPQLSARFSARFGSEVAVLHSGLSDRDRSAEWHRIRRGDAPIVVGARSAIFAPLERPRVIVVDEEHDPSFKQESGMRYHGRDLAIVRGRGAGSVVVLGSATPSLETLHNVARERYRLLRLPTRIDDRPLPEVELIDLRGRNRGKPEGGIAPSGLLSDELTTALRETLARGEQSIVFLNRRGHSTALLCRDCGDVCRCDNCAVAYTWHERRSRLVCHYCGGRREAPDTCPNCDSTRLLLTGAGTEKLEDELAAALPTARIARLDRDTAGNTRQLSVLLGRFQRREIDVLVGTQMVTKGHDFPGVTLVCVLLADGGLHQPDFRAAERTAQLLTQVAGRAGRGTTPGRVLVQTFTPEAPAVAAVVGHDYPAFARNELEEREAVGYPPYRRLCLVRLEGEDDGETQRHVAELAEAARKAAGVSVVGPAPAPLPRLRGLFRHQFLMKAQQHAALRGAVAGFADVRKRLPGALRLTIDLDPVDMM